MINNPVPAITPIPLDYAHNQSSIVIESLKLDVADPGAASRNVP
jgi:hypothetical protein